MKIFLSLKEKVALRKVSRKSIIIVKIACKNVVKLIGEFQNKYTQNILDWLKRKLENVPMIITQTETFQTNDESYPWWISFQKKLYTTPRIEN